MKYKQYSHILELIIKTYNNITFIDYALDFFVSRDKISPHSLKHTNTTLLLISEVFIIKFTGLEAFAMTHNKWKSITNCRTHKLYERLKIG